MSEETKKLSNEEKEFLDEEVELSREELVVEAKHIMEEVNSNPKVVNRPLPANLRENIDKRIRALGLEDKEAEAEVEDATEEKVEVATVVKAEAVTGENVAEHVTEEERFSEEERELMRLGKLYKKKRKMRKYFVLAAAVVCALAFGVTSMGGPERVFEKANWMLAGREQTNVDSDSDDILQPSSVEEEEIYEQIEDKFGFYPVKPIYRPEGIEFLEGDIGDEIQGVYLIYGEQDEAKITYFIRPNYRTGSLGKDIEDKLLEEYVEENEYTQIYIRKYLRDNEEERWSIQFEYQDVSYSMLIYDTSKEEVEKIVKNLFFS